MYTTFAQVKEALSEGVSVVDIVNAYLSRIEEKKDLNAFLEVFSASALEKAKEVDEKLKTNSAGKLAGMVIGLKDNIVYKGHHVSASSKILEGFESIYSATVVDRLLAEDAVIIGRLNCDEFAMGSSNENSAFDVVRNPINTAYVPGGSSGGSAAAVAANLCTVSLGSDTGGSIRQPASFTGTIGYKPTYGRISRFGLIAYASSFDQIGPFANDIKDIALVTEVMAGADEFDSTASTKKVDDLSQLNFEGKKSFAIIKEALYSEGLDPEVKERFKEIIEKLEAAGHEIKEVSFPYLNEMVPTYYVLTTAEASSNLARFDGVHFGYQSKTAQGVEETYKKSRTEGFGNEVKRRIMAGTFVLSNEFYDSYYSKAQKVRRVIQDKTKAILNDADFILLPTTPSTAFKLNDVKDPIQMYLQDIFTVQANLAGNPAISLPLGKHSNGLPFGVQLMGNSFEEKELLEAADYLLKNA
ncbi:MAG: Asp-tRNA(Asn)/Glu-tRNA(Gln) amidotransferase subunit GatA [Lishizhenia sp.]